MGSDLSVRKSLDIYLNFAQEFGHPAGCGRVDRRKYAAPTVMMVHHEFSPPMMREIFDRLCVPTWPLFSIGLVRK